MIRKKNESYYGWDEVSFYEERDAKDFTKDLDSCGFRKEKPYSIENSFDFSKIIYYTEQSIFVVMLHPRTRASGEVFKAIKKHRGHYLKNTLRYVSGSGIVLNPIISPGTTFEVIEDFDVMTEEKITSGRGGSFRSTITAKEGDIIEYVEPVIQRTSMWKPRFRFKLITKQGHAYFIATQGYIDEFVEQIESNELITNPRYRRK